MNFLLQTVTLVSTTFARKRNKNNICKDASIAQWNDQNVSKIKTVQDRHHTQSEKPPDCDKIQKPTLYSLLAVKKCHTK